MGMNTNLYQPKTISSLYEESKKAGFATGKFSSIKYQSKELWKHLKDKDKPLSEAYNEYIDETTETRDKLIEIFYELEENRNLKHFSEFAFSLKESHTNFYKTPASLYKTMNSLFIVVTTQTAYKTFLKHKKIIKMYEQYKKETKHINKTRDKLIEIFYELEENRNLKHFSEFAFSLKESHTNFYKNPVSLYNTIRQSLNINIQQKTSSRTFLRHKKIIKMYEQYKKETA